MEIKIFRAADAFLYLPTYIAEKKGIFNDLIKGTTVTFHTPESPSGDVSALEAMLGENENDSDKISFAICDPFACVSPRFGEDGNKFVVVGALIDKLPFWGVNHIKEELVNIKDFKHHFKKAIIYNQNLVTGNYLGNIVCNEAEMKAKPVNFGEELMILNDEYLTSGAKDIVAITADIISLAKQSHNLKNPLKINYRFSKDKRFIATGIVTSNNVCQNHPDKVIAFLRGIQKAIFILKSSKEIAFEVCKVIAQNDSFYTESQKHDKLNDDEIKWIVEKLIEEDFYPANLAIDKCDWDSAIEAYEKNQMWKSHHKQNSFEKYVNNDFILSSKKEIAQELGIDKLIYSDEVIPLIKELDTMKSERRKINKTLYRLVLIISRFSWKKFSKWILGSLVSVILIRFALYYIKHQSFNQPFLLDMGDNLLFTLIISLTGSFIKWPKKNDKR